MSSTDPILAQPCRGVELRTLGPLDLKLTALSTKPLICILFFFRCMFVKTVAIPPLSLKCTTYTWKRTTRTVLPFSNSTTRDILNSATQILQACCSKLIHKKPCISFWKQNLHKRGKLWAWLKEFVYNIFRKNSNSHCSKKYFFYKKTHEEH